MAKSCLLFCSFARGAARKRYEPVSLCGTAPLIKRLLIRMSCGNNVLQFSACQNAIIHDCCYHIGHLPQSFVYCLLPLQHPNIFSSVAALPLLFLL